MDAGNLLGGPFSNPAQPSLKRREAAGEGNAPAGPFCEWPRRFRRQWIERVQRLLRRGAAGGAKRLRSRVLYTAAAGILALLGSAEIHTSWLQAHLFSALAGSAGFSLAAGPSPAIRFPEHGPYDRRMGYARLPELLPRLRTQGYRIEAQARPTETLRSLTDWGLFPVYGEKDQAGLRILGREGRPLYARSYPERAYKNFEQVPRLVAQTLLLLENRELLDPGRPYRNPAVEWDRLARAVAVLGLHTINPQVELIGGSTLATQLEKLRHSPGGITPSTGEKLRQMLSASLRAYQDGQQTIEAQKEIVTAYLNSLPLSATAGWGEVIGLGDGLWAWFGADFQQTNSLLRGAEGRFEDRRLALRAAAYRKVLTLLLAVRQPSFYLLEDPQALHRRAERYLGLASEAGLISPRLRDLARQDRPSLLHRAPVQEVAPFPKRKAVDAVRGRLVQSLAVESVYELDRMDLSVNTPLDGALQHDITSTLLKLQHPEHAAKAGLTSGRQLLSSGDPASVVYSFTLYESKEGANLLRVQADTLNQHMNINDGALLELGSTAKLRTLITYLEIVAGLHRRYANHPEHMPQLAAIPAKDRITRWALGYLSSTEDQSLAAMLDAAMLRTYPASPAERFFTGGGLHRFRNFDSDDNYRVLTVREAFHRSVNLVFVRLMRDIVRYYIYQRLGVSPDLLGDWDHPLRDVYLRRFANYEGGEFLREFYRKHAGRSREESLQALAEENPPAETRLAVIHRTVRPLAPVAELGNFLQSILDNEFSNQELESLYQKYSSNRWNLQDLGYLAGLHPLELWLVRYLSEHPDATLDQVLEHSVSERQEAYRWLFRTNSKNAQDRAIRTIVERDAFELIHRQWQRLGYPFDSLVPSYATALGSSGDRPAALAELMGVIVNGGVRRPQGRVLGLHFAPETPFETVLSRKFEPGGRVLPQELADLVRQDLLSVVSRGTGRRARGVLQGEDGGPAVGGKTGTGDNRFETYGAGGRVLDSRVTNRTATFVFFFDRFFGVITAYVPGPQAAQYRFTSALPVQVFRHLAPRLQQMLDKTPDARPSWIRPLCEGAQNPGRGQIRPACRPRHRERAGRKDSTVPRRRAGPALLEPPEEDETTTRAGKRNAMIYEGQAPRHRGRARAAAVSLPSFRGFLIQSKLV